MYFKKYSVDVISYYLLISLYFFYKQECSSAQIQYNHSTSFLYFKHTHTHTHTLFLRFSISICWKLQVHTNTFNLNAIPVIYSAFLPFQIWRCLLLQWETSIHYTSQLYFLLYLLSLHGWLSHPAQAPAAWDRFPSHTLGH